MQAKAARQVIPFQQQQSFKLSRYAEGLNHCRRHYPFSLWLANFQEGGGYYSRYYTDMVQGIFDGLIQSLVYLGEKAITADKIALFEVSVRHLNLIKRGLPELINALEREEFCELLDDIARASGIDPQRFGQGRGIAYEWMRW